MIFTIGHSTRTAEEFTTLLEEHAIHTLVDVRRFPGSKRYPHFGKDQLAAWLPRAGIEYRHVDALGGRRTPRKDSPNDFWQNAQFRGYADHMQSEEFQSALAEVIEWSKTQNVALMCAEAVPWRCHRQMIADALVARRVPVTHIIAAGNTSAHELNSAARVQDGMLVYPPVEPQLDLLGE